MSDIFISYSREDKPWVKQLAAAFEADGYDVWWDPAILPGEDYERVISRALDETKCVVTVWSKDSAESYWVKEESRRGLEEKKLIPIQLENVEPPIPFGSLHTANLKNWKGNSDDPHYRHVLRAVHRLVSGEDAPLPAPKPVPSGNNWLAWAVAGFMVIAGGIWAGIQLLEPKPEKTAREPSDQTGPAISLATEQEQEQKELEEETRREAEDTRLEARETHQEMESMIRSPTEADKSDASWLDNALKAQVAMEKDGATREELEMSKAWIRDQALEQAQASMEQGDLQLARRYLAYAEKVSPNDDRVKRFSQQLATSAEQQSTTIDHYVDHGNGTVTDTQTGLMWKKCSEGQSVKSCRGRASTYKWLDANQQLQAVSFAGHNDWRMPSREELRTLVHCGNGVPREEAWRFTCAAGKGVSFSRPAIQQKVFPNTGKRYWSSTLHAANGTAWGTDFNGGNESYWRKNSDAYPVRLVRQAQ